MEHMGDLIEMLAEMIVIQSLADTRELHIGHVPHPCRAITQDVRHLNGVPARLRNGGVGTRGQLVGRPQHADIAVRSWRIVYGSGQRCGQLPHRHRAHRGFVPAAVDRRCAPVDRHRQAQPARRLFVGKQRLHPRVFLGFLGAAPRGMGVRTPVDEALGTTRTQLGPGEPPTISLLPR